jgi:hypothetical protein
MSCQRCGGVSAAELTAAMYDLVCGRAVIENRYCHCDDDKGSEQMNLSREAVGAFALESPKTTPSEGGPQ